MAMNKGEWSELYCILRLLLDKKLNIVNAKMEIIDNHTFTIKELLVEEKNKRIKFRYNDQEIAIYHDNCLYGILSNDYVQKTSRFLWEELQRKHKQRGAFDIDEMINLFETIGVDDKIKAKATAKNDVRLRSFDSLAKKEKELGYSIKSQLGSAATLLNSSQHTNIKYKVNGISRDNIVKINSINSKTKLLDRLNFINELGGKILFESIQSSNFNYNLELIDSKLPEALGEVVLNSYIQKTKKLSELFEMSTVFTDSSIAKKKLGDFLKAFSFDMVPSKRSTIYDTETFEVDGGIIIVKKDSNVYTLDLIYHEDEVVTYLINESKLDSPSSKRYNMLELFEENDEIYFTLNVQVRYRI